MKKELSCEEILEGVYAIFGNKPTFDDISHLLYVVGKLAEDPETTPGKPLRVALSHILHDMYPEADVDYLCQKIDDLMENRTTLSVVED